MKNYFAKRVLFFFPTLFILSLLAFIITINSPGDPVSRMTSSGQQSDEQQINQSNNELQEKYWRQKLGLNLPVFYIQLSSLAEPDTLYKLADSGPKVSLLRLLKQSGNWNSVATYYLNVCNVEKEWQKFSAALISSTTEEQSAAQEISNAFHHLKNTSQTQAIQFQFQVLESNLSYLHAPGSLLLLLNETRSTFQTITSNATPWKNYIPCLQFYTNNQYHRWMFGDGNWLSGKGSQFTKGIIRGDFGTSYSSKDAVSKKIFKRMTVSLFFAILSILLAYLISIPIALKAATNPHSFFDRASASVLFVLYSLPVFFVATLLLMIFSNHDLFNWFPSSGLAPAGGMPESLSFIEWLKLKTSYILLPLICYTYSSIAFLNRSMRSALLENKNLDYMRTARAKGLSEKRSMYKHAFKNALLPMITLFSTVFPLAMGGSVVLETIFTLPGMGLETYTAYQNQDYPVLVAVFTLTGFLSLVGSLLGDILYAFVDPRISFTIK